MVDVALLAGRSGQSLQYGPPRPTGDGGSALVLEVASSCIVGMRYVMERSFEREESAGFVMLVRELVMEVADLFLEPPLLSRLNCPVRLTVDGSAGSCKKALSASSISLSIMPSMARNAWRDVMTKGTRS